MYRKQISNWFVIRTTNHPSERGWYAQNLRVNPNVLLWAYGLNAINIEATAFVNLMYSYSHSNIQRALSNVNFISVNHIMIVL